MKIVQVFGSNGSGKTTIAHDLIGLSRDVTLLCWPGIKKDRVFATLLPDIGWAVIGEYNPDSRMGGCDRMKTIDDIKDAISTVVDMYPGLNGIMFEGMMISTIKSTFYNFLLEMERTKGIKPIFVFLRSTPEGCMKRIRGRGTMRANIDMSNVATKCYRVMQISMAYQPKYVKYIDVEKTARAGMFQAFTTAIGGYRYG